MSEQSQLPPAPPVGTKAQQVKAYAIMPGDMAALQEYFRETPMPWKISNTFMQMLSQLPEVEMTIAPNLNEVAKGGGV